MWYAPVKLPIQIANTTKRPTQELPKNLTGIFFPFSLRIPSMMSQIPVTTLERQENSTTSSGSGKYPIIAITGIKMPKTISQTAITFFIFCLLFKSIAKLLHYVTLFKHAGGIGAKNDTKAPSPCVKITDVLQNFSCVCICVIQRLS